MSNAAHEQLEVARRMAAARGPAARNGRVLALNVGVQVRWRLAACSTARIRLCAVRFIAGSALRVVGFARERVGGA